VPGIEVIDDESFQLILFNPIGRASDVVELVIWWFTFPTNPI